MSITSDIRTYDGILAPIALEAAQQYWPCRRNGNGQLCVRVDDLATVHIRPSFSAESPSNRPLGISRDDQSLVAVFTLPIVRGLQLTDNLISTVTFQARQFPRVSIVVQPEAPSETGSESVTVRTALQASAYLSTLAQGESTAILLDLAHAANTVRGAILASGDGSPYSVRVPDGFDTLLSIDAELLETGDAECPVPNENQITAGNGEADKASIDLSQAGTGPAVDPGLLRIREWTLEEAQRLGMQEMNVLLLVQVLAERDPIAFRRIFEVDSIKDVLEIHPDELATGGDERVDSNLKQVDWDWNAWELYTPKLMEQLATQCPDLVDLVREKGGWVRRDNGPRRMGPRRGRSLRAPQRNLPEPQKARSLPGADESSVPAPRRSELEAALKERVHGQDEAIEAVAARVAMAKRGLDGANSNRPDGVFLFAGPTGVGKTELAKALADTLYGEGDNLITLDMSEFHRDWSVSRIVGPMPGYAGSDRPDGWLTTKIIKAPRSVLLLDELEKADPAVWQLFLQVFDEGRLTDGSGATADFSETVIIATSNIGAQDLTRNDVGFVADGAAAEAARQVARKDAVEKRIRDTLPPELFNRFDRSVVFNGLDHDLLIQIAEGKLANAVADLAGVGYKLRLGRGVTEVVAAHECDPSLGARPLNRAIDQLIREPLADLDEGNYSVRALKSGELKFTRTKR